MTSQAEGPVEKKTPVWATWWFKVILIVGITAIIAIIKISLRT